MRTVAESRRLGEYLPCPQSALDWALSVQTAELAAGNVKPIGEILLERELISQEELGNALRRQRVDRLRQCFLFSGLSDDELGRINTSIEEVELATGQSLLNQEQRGNSMYMVAFGRVLLYRRGENQEAVPVGVALPGDFIGEMDYFSDGTRSCSAYAVEPTTVLKIRYQLLPDLSLVALERAEGFTEASSAPSSLGPILRNLASALEISSDTDPGPMADALIAFIQRRACQTLQAGQACLFLVDPKTEDLLSSVTIGKERRGIRVRAGTEIPGWVARSKEVVNVPEAYLNPRFNPVVDIWTGNWTRSLLAGPVHNRQGDVIGVVQVMNKRLGSFSDEDEALIRALSCQFATAIEKCRLARFNGKT